MNLPKQLKEKIENQSIGYNAVDCKVSFVHGGLLGAHLTAEYILGLLESEEAVHLMKHPGNISEIAGATLMSGKKWAEFIRAQIEKDGVG